MLRKQKKYINNNNTTLSNVKDYYRKFKPKNEPVNQLVSALPLIRRA